MVTAVQSQKTMHQVIDSSFVLASASAEMRFTYTFENFFHPFVGRLIEQLNTKSLAGLLDADEHKKWTTDFFEKFYDPLESNVRRSAGSTSSSIRPLPTSATGNSSVSARSWR